MNNRDHAAVHGRSVTLSDLLTGEPEGELSSEILEGLRGDRKYISSRFFYDDRGSRLFGQITALPEYYLTRTEKSILERYAPQIMGAGNKRNIVELGSGDSTKISILLKMVPIAARGSIRYYPVDISRSSILQSAAELARNFPGLRVNGILADFMKHLGPLPGTGRRMVCFFGSTLGNFTREQAEEYLAKIGKMMQPGDSFFLGLDMVKETGILEAAYNDSRGITAEFNRNILRVVNRLTGTDFDPGDFDHLAFYNREDERIEMHLVARQALEVRTPLMNEPVFVAKGEAIHTENSHKFTARHIGRLAEAAGLEIRRIYGDPSGWFSVVHLPAEHSHR